MFASQPAAETRSLPPGRTAIVWATIAVLAAAFYCIEHNAEVSTLEYYSIPADEMAERAAEGDATRRAAISAIGLFARCCCSAATAGPWGSNPAPRGCSWPTRPGAE